MRFEQYEIWVLEGEKWRLSSSFADFEIANSVAHDYAYRMRLIRAVYENGKCVQQEILAEMGATRERS